MGARAFTSAVVENKNTFASIYPLAQDALEAEQVPVVLSTIEGDTGVAGAVLLAFEAGVAAAEVEA